MDLNSKHKVNFIVGPTDGMGAFSWSVLPGVEDTRTPTVAGSDEIRMARALSRKLGFAGFIGKPTKFVPSPPPLSAWDSWILP